MPTSEQSWFDRDLPDCHGMENEHHFAVIVKIRGTERRRPCANSIAAHPHSACTGIRTLVVLVLH